VKVLGALRTSVLVCVLAFVGVLPVFAQPQAETRPATTSTSGDTGLWFVPTAEVLPAKRWSASGYRVNTDFEQGFTDVSNFPLTFGFGLRDRLELFGALTVVNRIDRDVRPLFGDPASGGVVNEYPFVADGWTGSNVGDIWVGGKFNITSQSRQHPVAFALRGMLKVPTANDDNGAGTGKTDVVFDGIVSGELNERVELSAFGGFIVRGDPDTFDLSNGIRWGIGAAMPARKHLRLTAELHGEQYLSDTISFTGVQTQVVGGIPLESEVKGPVNATLGLTWLGANGLFAGAGINWNLRHSGRSDFGAEDETGDALGFQFRLGYHPGVRRYVPPEPPKDTPKPALTGNRPPSLRARCEPCTVPASGTSALSAQGTDPDGDTLTYRWSVSSGTLGARATANTPWTAPAEAGTVIATVEVEDGRGGRATDAVTLSVTAPPPPAVKVEFEDVHFDFDRYSLRPEATRALDEAVKAMLENRQLTVDIEGHTCNIGTAEYNLALGERRSISVRDYLVSRGITADRIRTVSYGEERPKHDNAREETRRLNRRAALVVRVVR
jgi:outer membrane protein OmpA-like peptidoglycan-associated protein